MARALTLTSNELRLEAAFSLPRPLELATAEAHVWLFPNEVLERRATELFRNLTVSDWARIEPLRGTRAHRRRGLGRAALRQTLAAYLDFPPADLQIVAHTPPGTNLSIRPRIVPPPGAEPLFFSISYSHEATGYACARSTLGFDLEHHEAASRGHAHAQGLLAERQRAELARLAPPLRVRAFCRMWTQLEAVLKADGRGLAVPETERAVALARHRVASLPFGGHAAAIAVTDSVTRVKVIRVAE